MIISSLYLDIVEEERMLAIEELVRATDPVSTCSTVQSVQVVCSYFKRVNSGGKQTWWGIFDQKAAGSSKSRPLNRDSWASRLIPCLVTSPAHR